MATVNEKMTAIAEPIRTFMKESDKLSLDDMADRANQVVTANENLEKVLYGTDFGGKSYYDILWDKAYKNGENGSFMNCFGGHIWNKETFKPKRQIIAKGTNGARNMFFCFGVLEDEPLDYRTVKHMIDLTQVTQAICTFYSAKINYIEVDLSNCTNLQACFSAEWNPTGRTHLTLKVSEKCTNYSSTFAYNSELTHMLFMEGSVIGANISFAQSSKLTFESLSSITNALKDLTGTGLTRILTLHADSKELLNSTSEGRALIAMATDQKGWTIA